MSLNVSSGVQRKITARHGVSVEEVEQCFANRGGNFLKDSREQHKSVPPAMWFVAETDYGRKLKIVFIQEVDESITLKTAYEANTEELRIYEKFGA